MQRCLRWRNLAIFVGSSESQELYVSFNDIKDLSPLLAHEVGFFLASLRDPHQAVQIVDLEGNLVDDFDEVASLEALASLRELDLSRGPRTSIET